ncbi:MAG TPA: tetratricopeptide repeat protein [Polyangiaceae bacterium]|nr:tetratricopeptide repeat protein [Polyangiaceae bacterium]
MSSLDLHPEELLDRERQGSLDADARRRLDKHVDACRVCRFEQALGDDFQAERTPQTGDNALLERALATTFEEKTTGRKTLALKVAVAIALMAIAAAAAVAIDRTRREPLRALDTMLPAPPITLAPPAPKVEAPPISSAAPTSSAPDVSAAELFHRANAARRAGNAAEAARLYRLLQQRFPGSREAGASRLALARLLLDRLGDAAGALALFDQALASGGVLAEEALLGRAMALGRLGRTADERAAWETFLARYPNSVNAERARRRLDELRP